MIGSSSSSANIYLIKSPKVYIGNHPDIQSWSAVMSLAGSSDYPFSSNSIPSITITAQTISPASVTEHSPTPSIFLPMDSNYTSDTSFWIKDLYVYDLKVKIIYNFMFSQELERKLV